MKILVLGGSGLVGQAIKTISKNYSYQFIFHSSNNCNLKNLNDTLNYFQTINPTHIIHLAAQVGGLFKNMNYKVKMLEDNLLINYNVLHCAHLCNINNVISCLSTCIFPDKVEYPINEDQLHMGPPHFSNDAYAYAKRLLEIHSRAYQEQYNRNYKCIIPVNIYGPYDNFNLEDGHVIPSLIHRCYLSVKENEPFVVKGTGKPLRQFIYSEDLANLIMIILEKYEEREPIILAVNEENTIKEAAEYIAECFGKNELIFDSSFADGQYKKTADNSKLKKLLGNYEFKTLKEGIKETVEWFKNNYEISRK